MNRITICIAAVILALSGVGRQCQAQWMDFSRTDLQKFAEDLILNKKVSVLPPGPTFTPMAKGKRQLTFDLGDFPRHWTNDPMFDRVFNAQFQVSLIRAYRNTPARRQGWKPFLNAAELQIEIMINTVRDPNLTAEQKSVALGAMEDRIDQFYRARLDKWCQDDPGIGSAQLTCCNSPHFNVQFVTEPDGAVVTYVTAGKYALYQLAQAKNPTLPPLDWVTPTGRSAILVGMYYFKAEFNGSQPKTTGPALVDKDVVLVFTPNGMRSQK